MISEILRDRRVELGLSMREVGEAIHKSGHCVGSWERGHAEPCINDIKKICTYYEMSPNELLNWGNDIVKTDGDILHDMYIQLRRHRVGVKHENV